MNLGLAPHSFTVPRGEKAVLLAQESRKEVEKEDGWDKKLNSHIHQKVVAKPRAEIIHSSPKSVTRKFRKLGYFFSPPQTTNVILIPAVRCDEETLAGSLTGAARLRRRPSHLTQSHFVRQHRAANQHTITDTGNSKAQGGEPLRCRVPTTSEICPFSPLHPPLH